MNAGDLRHKVTIQKPAGTTRNEFNEEVPDYQDFKTVWAAVEPYTGREYNEAQKIRAETTYRVKIRYTQGLKQDMKVILKDGRELEILNILNIREKNMEIHMICAEKVK